MTMISQLYYHPGEVPLKEYVIYPIYQIVIIREMCKVILEELTAKINKYVEDLEFATARVFIEENIDTLSDHKNRLNKNARDLLTFLLELQKDGQQPITRKDLAVLNAINTYANKFDLRGLKVLVRDNTNLLLRKDVPAYLNSDARIILEGMGAISKYEE